MPKLAKNTVIWSKKSDSESIEMRKNSEYPCLRIPRVYIGRLQSSSRLLALNGFYVWICNRLAMICNRVGP
jgi:hypothetical protein